MHRPGAQQHNGEGFSTSSENPARPLAPAPITQNRHGENTFRADDGLSDLLSPPRSTRSPLRGLLWPTIAVVLTSCIGAAILVGLRSSKGTEDGYLGSTPDTRGYQLTDTPCTVLDLKPIAAAGAAPATGSSPTYSVARHPAVDTSQCRMTLTDKGGRTTVFLDTTATVHKVSNPVPAFLAEFETVDQQSGKPEVEKISGLGDDAYIVYERNGALATLRVRDGWFVYEILWRSSSPSSDIVPRDAKSPMLQALASHALSELSR
ncbi:hypothetical protein [Nocardia sp. NPDC057668]|uniref:hypothetical protein n=1 Tax=Nocardia sp. NPDC057668 TaxID=3346202 RepID=UPI0036720F1F